MIGCSPLQVEMATEHFNVAAPNVHVAVVLPMGPIVQFAGPNISRQD